MEAIYRVDGYRVVNFARQPVGAWILLDAESQVGPDRAGVAAARLADERG
jgi:hypothetical protein